MVSQLVTNSYLTVDFFKKYSLKSISIYYHLPVHFLFLLKHLISRRNKEAFPIVRRSRVQIPTVPQPSVAASPREQSWPYFRDLGGIGGMAYTRSHSLFPYQSQ